MGALGNFGRSRARRVEAGEQKVTFDDVAGIDEAKAELTEIVDFLKNPDRYRRLGGRIPRGVLLVRPPGHRQDAARARGGGRGRRAVLLGRRVGVRRGDRRRRRGARARPVQAGQGGLAVDHLHRRARRGRPLARGGFSLGGNDEREQTLNQILTEMDGFESDEAVIVLGATNRPEVLDAALLRPGPLRPPRRRAAARQGGPPPDPRGAHALAAARRRRRPRPPRGDHARHGRRRPREPRQRGGADGGAAQPRARSRWPTSPTRSRRSCSARRAAWSWPARSAAASPTTRPGHALVGHAHAGRRPGAQGLDHPARRWRSA